MDQQNMQYLMVEDAGEVLGALYEDDYSRELILCGKSIEKTPAREIMTARIANIDSHMSVRESVELSKNNQAGYLVVHDGANLLGMITIGELYQEVIEDQQNTIEQLQTNLADLYKDLATMDY